MSTDLLTVAERLALVRLAQAAGLKRTRAELPPIERADRGARLPLSFAQQRLWFLERLGGMGSTYHIPGRLSLRGAPDRQALVRALDRLLQRHEALRTTFAETDGEPEQRIGPETTRFALVEQDLAEEGREAVERVVAEEAAAPFDLEHGPLIRGRLVRLGEDDHVLLLTMHHIVSDGWSMGVLTDELGRLYAAFRAGDPDPLAPLPIQYADYAAWQRRWVEGEVLEAQAGYWKRTLAGAPALLELPIDRTRPQRQDHAGAYAALELDEALTAGLKELGRKHGATPFMTLLAGWAVVLARLSRQDDVVIGMPTANRGRKEIEGLIGFFVNTLALRVDLSSSPTVAQLLAQVKARALEAQQNQDIPFEQVVDAVQPARSMSYSPLFQVVFAWQNARGGPEMPGMEPGGLRGVERTTAKFDLSLRLAEMDGRFTGGLTFATALFERETVERWLGCLRRVLEQMAADDAQAVDRLDLLAGDERALVVDEWNRTEAEYPRDACLHQLFEAQAARTPGATALVYEGRSLTYAELNARANRLAHHLAARGVGPDVCVALCLERSLEMVEGVLAVLKAGGAYVALDPDYPAERLRYMLQDSAPAALLAHASLAERFDGMGVPVIAIDRDAAAWAHLPETDPGDVGVTPEHLVYVIYTSGSTGWPKGVMNTHRNVVNRVAGIQRRWELETGEAVLQNASLSFDVSAYEIFWPLMMGARVVMTRPDGHKDPDYLVDLIRGHDVGTASFVPSSLQLFLEHPHAERCTSLRRVPCGGEALPAALVRRLAERLPQAKLYNRYGPSEAATAVTGWSRPEAERAGSVPIGTPMPNARAYVLDRRGATVPVGVVGELCIGGHGVGRGYLHRPDLTAEKFVPDPFSGLAGARLYRTGDLARWLADGTIEFLGRNDFQVKVRGLRVEPGEIEARLAEHPQVREAVVMAREHAPGDMRLVAWYVASGAVDVESLRAHLLERVPEHMVPAAFVAMAAMPLTPNGKLDRAALPAPDGDAYARRGYEAPATEMEAALAGIWSEVLGVDGVGRWDHFFELGGHSLLAVRVISRVRQVLGAEMALSEVFARPVLAELARAVEAAGRADLPEIEPADRSARLPLSFAQQRLWFLEQMGNLGSAYHISKRVRLRGELHRDALVRALDRIVARHEVLRTTFAEVEGEPEQRIAPAEESVFNLIEHDLTGQGDADEEMRRLAREEATSPFDLSRGPLIRGRLVRLADDDHVLLLTLHHIVSDAWSTGVLVNELGRLYAAFGRGEGDPLAPLAVQYADYAAWQRRWVRDEVLEAQAAYWTRTLAGAPELLELPTDRPRPARHDHAGAALRVDFDEALTAGLRELSRKHGTTLFMTMLAGWATVLARLSGQDDVVIGTPTANRGRREIEGLIGFFVNTLALRIDLPHAPTVAELLARVKARAVEAQQNQDIPFEQVVERVQPARSLAHSPLFQVMFAWQTAQDRFGLPGLDPAPVAGESHTTAKFDLTLMLSEAGGRIAGGLTYATSLFERETVERHLGYLRRVLEEMVADDTQPVDRLALLPASERARIVEEWNATDAAFPRDACIHQLFEAQAARTPDAEAVRCEGEALTYVELNRRANRLAHHLRALGVGPETRVGVCLERRVEMMVALLGVLKAGAAYVPLDPAYPADRLAFTLRDAGVPVLLTQESLLGIVPVPGGVRVVSVDAAADEIARESDENPLVSVASGNLAYLIYTSGSTGVPKGVAIAHESAVALVSWASGIHTAEEMSGVMASTSICFDLSVYELFLPLSLGGRIVLVENALALPRSPDAGEVRLINTVPSAIAALLDGGAIPAGVRTVNLAGEPLRPELVDALYAHGIERVFDLYGPSEDTTYSTWTLRRAGGPATIGRPIANTRAYVLDAAMQPLPVGVPGELCLGGRGLARGYLGRPALTAEKFVPDPFSAVPGGRLYRTGDLARWRADGTLEFLGRRDAQVKVRGFRIELGEIEARLREHPQVRDAVVLAREDAPGQKRLVAYVAGEDVETEALRAHLGVKLPEYMVPAAYVHLDALPLTPNGKIDRKALPAPAGDAGGRRGFAAPQGETEQALAEIWGEVLGVERVGRFDNFFELGGHSLLAVQVISRVRQALGAQVDLGEVFARPVLSELAEALAGAGRAELPSIERAERGGRLPLSYAQQRLWFLEQMGGLGSAYHLGKRLRLRGALDREALVRALDRLMERHEALRTTFRMRGGEPEQWITPAAECAFALRYCDLSGDAAAAPDALQRALADEATAPFDLLHGPLFRGRLIRLAADDHVLVLTMHHIVSDGWSMGVLVDELGRLHAAFRAGDPDPLAPLPIQYADYAAWQRRWVEAEVLERQAGYWTRTLGGAPALLELPTDHPRPARQDHAGAALRVELDEALTAGLKELGRRHGTTLFMTLLAGWATVLSRLSGQDDVVIGTPTANRGRREIEGLIGFFVNTLALRVETSGSPSVGQLLERVKARALEAQQNQDIPFEQVVERVDPARTMAHAPLFQVMFAWQNAGRGDLALPGLQLAPVPGTEGTTAKFDLSLTLSEADGRITGGLTWATSLFERETMERYVGYLRRVLEAFVADDARAVDALPLLPEAERRLVVEEWNATQAEYPRGASVHDLFRAQAARTPDAIAISWQGERVTYAELEARANRLAHALRRRGVGPETRVGIFLPRTPEMLVAMLGVHAAGGAYVPLDPAYPRERLGWMIEDADVALVITESAIADRLPEGAAALLLDRDRDTIAAESGDAPESGVVAENLSHVIFTSGSTGRPKGVMIRHSSVIVLLHWLRETISDAERASVLFSTSINFDVSVAEVFGTLCWGGKLVLVENALELARLGEEVVHASMVPSAAEALLRTGGIPACVKTLNLGGEALPNALAQELYALGTVEKVGNLYGPTEDTTYSTYHLVPRGADRVLVGTPVANTQAYVLDAHLQPVPVGVVGELYLAGDGLSRGYANRPAMTAERFVPCPFGAPGGRMYRVMDRVRRQADGQLEYLGRTDFQVKVRGFRIELGEIESRLREHAGVREAVVLAREDAPGQKRLVAYYVGDAADAEALRAHLGVRVPEYMVPAAYVRLEAMPHTPNGKLDRTALPAPEDGAFARRGHESPVGETEETLAEIWAALLGVERVGRTDNFFELGGHSLLVIQLVERMREHGLHAEVRTLFVAPTLAALAAAVGEAAPAMEVPANLIPTVEADARDEDADEVEFVV